MVYLSRNDALGFAQRTRKNLEYIENAFKEGADVHVVTQLVISLLGLVVFLKERKMAERLNVFSLSELETLGWPHWDFDIGDCNTLGQLIRHLRNSVAHGHIIFSSESRALSEVYVQAEDYHPRKPLANWKARISASNLQDFCLRYIDLVEKTID